MLVPSGPSTARLMIVLDCASYRDLQSNLILSDRDFDRILSDAGVNRAECFITALIRESVPGQDFDNLVARSKRETTPRHQLLHDRHVLPVVVDSYNRLCMDIALVKPKVILAIGNGALFALTGKWGIKSWRSSILPIEIEGHSCHIVPTYPPSYLNAVYKDRLIASHDIRKAHQLSIQSDPIVPPTYNFIIEPTFPQAASALQSLLTKASAGTLDLSVDVETRAGHLACVGIAWSASDAICIPQLRAHFDPTRTNYWAHIEEEAFITHLIYRLLTHPNVKVIGQNFIYDAQYFYRHFHFIPNFARDTMLAQHSMFSNMQKSLDFLSSLYCAHHIYWKDDSKNWDPKLGERQLWIYNCVDCVRTFEIDTAQQIAIDNLAPSWPQLRAIHDFQQSLFHPVLNSMILGLRVDNSSKATLSTELSAAIATRMEWLTSALGHPINIKSPLQMKDLFYRELAQKPIISRKTGNPTCDDSALERIASREPLLIPVCSTIQELRSLNVFRSTFLEAPTDLDDRMRCSFNIGGTETYRFSSSENAFGSGLNLQNIPSGDESEGLPNIRKLFLADSSMEFFDVDLDSADLRVVVWESDCQEMKSMFAEGLKPYVEIAKEYYRDPTITKSHPSYKLFKALCHGTNYLGSASGLASRIGLLAIEIERIQKWYYQKFPEIKTWQDDLSASLRSNRYVENVFGYRIHFLDRIEGTVYNQAIAAIPQSTVSCLINRAYHNLYTHEPDIQVLLQVHDSLAGQYPLDVRDSAIERIISRCSIELPYEEPLIIPVGIKTSTISWGDCE